MKRKRTFIQQFWKDKKMVGSIRPSSRFLADKMLQEVDFSTARIIVELGPGTGVFTHKIIELMDKDAVLFVFELNQQFYRNLKKTIKDKRVILIYDSAEKLESYLNEHSQTKADVIISSLPLSNFPIELRENIIQSSYDNLISRGKYIQYQYSTQAKKLLEDAFDTVTISFTPLNFPPAFIYSCEKR